MSDKPKHPAARARAVADQIVKWMAPACTRIEIAGSLRRGKSEVGDIEILYVSRPTTMTDPLDLFKERQITVPAADIIIQSFLADGRITKRLNKDAHPTWGELNKLAVAVKSGIPVDFFATTEQNWWMSLVFRTGSLETNLKLTKAAIERGRRLHAYGAGITDRLGDKVAAYSEREVFELCGVPYLEPHER